MPQANARVVLLAGPGASTAIVYNALRQRFEITAVVMEAPVPRTRFLWRRVGKLGILRVGGQMLFRALVVPLLYRLSRNRLATIKQRSGLDDSPIPTENVIHVESANSPEAKRILRELDPAVVVINGTRVLSRDVLDCTTAAFVNLHAGITPAYRGVHGGYWALANRDPERCGVTVHEVDERIDAGAVLFQARIQPGPEDNFVTYPLLQLAAGLPLLEEAIRSARDGRLVRRPPLEGPSRLWTHPTLWQYLRYRSQGVR